MKEQNSTQKVNKRENQWIVLSQICIAWQGTAILAVKKNSSFAPYCCGITKPQNFGKTSNRSKKTTNLVRKRETVKQQQNILDGRFNSTPVHVDGIAKGKSRRRRGNFKEKSQDKSKD